MERRFIGKNILLLAVLVLLLPPGVGGANFPQEVTDTAGNRLQFAEKPRRVVSLLPYITEMLLEIGQEKTLTGLTRQDFHLNPVLRKKNIGGCFSPDIDAIAACRPDLIIAAPSHQAVIHHFADAPCPVMVMKVEKMEDAFSQMEMLGRVFACEDRAAAVIRKNRDKLAKVKARLEAVPQQKRKRVVRVMAGEGMLSCPGDDSFQNEMIVAAGGIVPEWGQTGFAVPVGLKEWQIFNPQFIYGCNQNAEAIRALLARKGWNTVEAVKNGVITMFPCELTCQVSTRVGDFVQWLAATLYLETFADPETAVLPDAVLDKKPLQLDLDYVRQAQIVRHRVADAEYKSVVITFNNPLEVISTFEGLLSGISAVGNTYVPMHASLGHMAYGVEPARTAICKNLGIAEDRFTGLMTGANMDNLAVREENWKNVKVVALVTAGVKGNAMRMSRDTGAYYSHGTINIIILTNHRLSAGAMARAIITATEAKSAALLDMDIRSTYLPLEYKATGTGTDNVMVIQGEGLKIPYGGGHTKIGELIARAVHAGVTEAVARQNGLKADRDLFQRLADRHLRLAQIVASYPSAMNKKELTNKLAIVLQQAEYAAFLASALALSDEYHKRLIRELNFWDDLCCLTAAKLSGRRQVPLARLPRNKTLPVVLDRAFGALIAGIELQNGEGDVHHE